MGIKGLYTYISYYASNTLEWMELKNTTVIIDGSNMAYWLYGFEDGRIPTVYGGEYQTFAIKVRKFFLSLLDCNIEPIVIMDGGHCQHQRKMKTVLLRMRDMTMACARITPEGEDSTLAFPMMIRQVFVDIVKSLGIECLQCDFEADEDIIVVAKKLDAFVLSNDTDFFLSDVKFVILRSLNLDNLAHDRKKNPNRGIPCFRFDRDLFCEMTKIKKKLLPFIAVCVGNDSHDVDHMRNFHKILPPAKRAHSLTHKLIYSSLRWLKDQPQDYIRIGSKILDHIDYNNKHVVEGIKMCVASYVPKSSNMWDLIEKKRKLPKTNNVFPTNCITEVINFKNDLSYPEGISDIETSTNTSCCTIAYNEPLPQWFVDAYRSFYVHNMVAEMLHQRRFFCVPVVECRTRPSVHAKAETIVKSVRAIMWKTVLRAKKQQTEQTGNPKFTLKSHTPETLKSFSSSKDKIHLDLMKNYYAPTNAYKKNYDAELDEFSTVVQGDILSTAIKTNKLPNTRWYYRVKSALNYQPMNDEKIHKYDHLPSLYDITSLEKADRKKIFFQVLGFSIEVTQHLPSVLHTIFVYICHWGKENRTELKPEYICSVIMNVIMFTVAEGRYGSHKEDFHQKPKSVSENQSVNQCPPTVTSQTIESFLEQLSKNECKSAIWDLSPYVRPKSVKNVKSKNFDRDIVHFGNAYQASVFYLSLLNSVLGFPFLPISIEKFWSGTFHYNMSLCFTCGHPMAVAQALLPNSPKMVHLFGRLHDLVNEQLSFTSIIALEAEVTKEEISKAGESMKTRHNKPQIPVPVVVQSSSEDEDIQNEVEEESEEESDPDISMATNRFAALVM